MLHRRDAMLRLGQVGFGALALPQLLRAESMTSRRGTAQSCILVFLWGGPPQQDLWDMKPDAPQGIRSLFQPMASSVPGVQICDQMPRLARLMHHVAVVRSVTHGSNEHEPSVYHLMTGKQNPQLRVPTNQRKRSDFPNVPAIVARFSPAAGVPASVTIPQPIGHDGVTYSGTYAGFLGPKYDALELKGAPKTGESPFALGLPDGMEAGRVIARKGLLRIMETQDRLLQRHGATSGLAGFQEQAFRMVASPQVKRAFEIDREPPNLRDRYGRNEFGECFLLSRRLVEAGVRLVTLNWMYVAPTGRLLNVWDNHGGTADLGSATGYAMLTSNYCIPPLDQGLSTLLEDLDQRGLLGETLVVVLGEFGRTPKINATQGRDHWGACQSVLLAGGGIRGGQTYGSTDKIAAYVKDCPVSPEDLQATIYHGMGVAVDGEIHDRDGRPYPVTTGRPLVGLFT